MGRLLSQIPVDDRKDSRLFEDDESPEFLRSEIVGKYKNKENKGSEKGEYIATCQLANPCSL
jgi:hypothetical protein